MVTLFLQTIYASNCRKETLMRLCHIFIMLLFLSQISISSMAGETNELYVTEDSFGLYASQHDADLHHARLLAKAKTIRESLPAKEFPEGNWGHVTNGFQLSLRFDKQAYKNGEQITAILLIRNTTNRTIKYLNDFPVEYSVINASGQRLASKYEHMPFPRSGGYRDLPRETQHKYLERLDGVFVLTNGNYSVQAILPAPYSKYADGKSVALTPFSEIKSAIVLIKIN